MFKQRKRNSIEIRVATSCLYTKLDAKTSVEMKMLLAASLSLAGTFLIAWSINVLIKERFVKSVWLVPLLSHLIFTS